MWRRLCAWMALAVLAGPAAAEPALNKEGYWWLAAGDSGCFATMSVAGGVQFMLIGEGGELSFAVGAKKLRAGKAGKLQTDTASFDFTPSYDGKDILFLDDKLNEKAVGELRKAREVVVIVDERVVMGAKVEGTGFEEVLSAALACSKGESGWWGKGFGARTAKVEAGPAAGRPREAPPVNKEGVWAIIVGDSPGICIAQAEVKGGLRLQVLSAAGQLGLAVASDSPLPNGRRGRVEADTFKFDFRPNYGGPNYLAMDDPMDSASAFALRRAKAIYITVDGRAVADAAVEGSGFAQVMDDVAACSKGAAGWWGPGAAARR
jgi:hypothetical protein